MISLKAQYALKAVLALARVRPDDVLMTAEIAESQGIPKKFLEQILLDLKHQGVVVSRRGKTGGYMLRKSPDLITFGEILRIIEGPLAPLPCLSRSAYRRCDGCADEAACEIRRVFARVAEANRRILDGTTIADCLAGSGQSESRNASLFG
ncbi:MAG: RrF2 family transcriptional regulator [Pannonibacter sp.]